MSNPFNFIKKVLGVGSDIIDTVESIDFSDRKEEKREEKKVISKKNRHGGFERMEFSRKKK